MLIFGVGGGGRGEDDVEKVGRPSGKILTTHLLKTETEQQESWRKVLSYHLSGVVLSRKRWSRITHGGMKKRLVASGEKRSDNSGKRSFCEM